jgi:alpha-tubulin suppressor-like RCC1 family protein
MSTRYPGGLIRKTPPTITPPVGGEGGSAPGVWTLEQASYYTKQGTWPKQVFTKQLWGSGYNADGYIGDNTGISRSSAVQVGSDTTWLTANSSYTFSNGALSTGAIYSWGNNQNGYLGIGNVTSKSSPTQIGALTNWSQNIVNGFYHSLAVKTDGTLWSWGWSTKGQLGTNFQGASGGDGISSPVQVGSLTNWSKVGCTFYGSLAIKTDGTLWSWGDNTYGDLGLNDRVDRSSPVQVGALTNWALVSGTESSAFAIKTDGSLWAWGRNSNGQLGQNDLTDRSSPVQIGALTNWSKIATGGRHLLAVKTDGTLWGLGINGRGQIGDNTIIDRSSPVQIGADTTWMTPGCGYQQGYLTKTDKTLWSWGRNHFGQLRSNDKVYRSSPVQVNSGTNWGSPGRSSFGNVFFSITSF